MGRWREGSIQTQPHGEEKFWTKNKKVNSHIEKEGIQPVSWKGLVSAGQEKGHSQVPE